MNCRYCGVDLRLYTVNSCGGHECFHASPAPKHIVEAIYSKTNVDLLTIIARLQKVVDELERRVVHSYRT